ncbi:hypothetical protein CAPN010_10970 [Capnocytophaga cynodegmi]|uniref:hypothetical protein n=1 Tax=Capnocytophaga cynodegmi TaxID=28189 RepID=UPI001EE170CB|nr:hypothetical protein [Capnocytophaga cynodegmi]GJQ06939.1 hypothetical protein CAPN010_10970 [Capnocytophaga cynodegmi]
MEKIQVEFDENSYNGTLRQYEQQTTEFKKLVDKILGLNLEIAFAPDDLVQMTENPKAFFVSKIVKEPLNLNGLELNKEKVFDILSLPDELQNVIQEIEQFKISKFFKGHPLYKYAPNFEISENEVLVSQTTKDETREQFTIYLTNEKQKTAHTHLKNIIENLKALKQVDKNFKDSDLFHKYILIYNSGEIKIDFSTLKRIE